MQVVYSVLTALPVHHNLPACRLPLTTYHYLPPTHNRSPPSRKDATERLRAATKWYPLHDLGLAVAAAEASGQAVDGAVLAEAHARLAQLATDELVTLMYRRQLEPLVAAVAELEAE